MADIAGSRRSLLLVGVAVTSVALYLALKDTDFAALVQALRGARLDLVPAFLACLVIFYGMKVVRWRWLLEADGNAPSIRSLAGPMMAGFAANNLLPFRLGELARAILGARTTGMSTAAMLVSIVIERILDVVALMILGFVAVGLGPPGVTGHPVMRYAGLAAPLLGAVLLAGALATGRLDDRVRRRAERSTSAVARTVGDWSAAIRAGTGCIRDRRSFLRLVAWSTIHWIAILVSIRIACLAVGVDVDYAVATYLLVLVTLAVSVPSAPGFVGVIEYGFVVGLGAFGVGADRALAAAVFYHALNWISVTAVGTVYLHRMSLTWGDIRRSPTAHAGGESD